MPPEPAPNPPAAPMGDWGDFPPAVPLPPLEAELIEPDVAEDAAFRALVEEIEGPPPLDAVEVTDPPVDPAARALIDEIEGPVAPPAPNPRPPRAVPVARPVPPAPEPDPQPEASPFPQIVGCPRCGEKVEPIENRCPWCSKWLVGRPPKPRPRAEDEDEPADEPVWYGNTAAERVARRTAPARQFPPMAVVFVSYGLLLGSLIALAAYAVANSVTSQKELYGGMLAVGLFDAVLTVGALALVWTHAQQPSPGSARVVRMWLLALPVLGVLLFLNISYITLLRELFRPFGAAQAEKIDITFATVFLICVLPALMEEAFFRQLALGVFRRSMNLHAAVWLAAGLFALAHLANPLGMPYLFVAGAAFGYARAYGGLPLAMLMHFLHNLAVIGYEAWK